MRTARDIAKAVAKTVSLVIDHVEERKARERMADKVELTYRRRLEANRRDSVETLVKRNRPRVSFLEKLRNWWI